MGTYSPADQVGGPQAGASIRPQPNGGVVTMAEEIRIANSDSTAKVRNPLGVLGLSLVTIGIYFFFWWYFINREMRDLGRARNTDLGQNPGNSVLAITLGALVIVPAIVTMWTTSARLENAQETVGIERRVSGPIVFILLLLIGPVGIWYAQSELNKAWDAQRTGAAAEPTIPGASEVTAGQPPAAPPVSQPPAQGPEVPPRAE
jgi:hypothetical protein